MYGYIRYGPESLAVRGQAPKVLQRHHDASAMRELVVVCWKETAVHESAPHDPRLRYKCFFRVGPYLSSPHPHRGAIAREPDIAEPPDWTLREKSMLIFAMKKYIRMFGLGTAKCGCDSRLTQQAGLRPVDHRRSGDVGRIAVVCFTVWRVW